MLCSYKCARQQCRVPGRISDMCLLRCPHKCSTESPHSHPEPPLAATFPTASDPGIHPRFPTWRLHYSQKDKRRGVLRRTTGCPRRERAPDRLPIFSRRALLAAAVHSSVAVDILTSSDDWWGALNSSGAFPCLSDLGINPGLAKTVSLKARLPPLSCVCFWERFVKLVSHAVRMSSLRDLSVPC